MRKATWMAQLERALSREGMTGTEKRTVLNYYEEMYQDRLDEGAEEEDIIKEFGFPEDVAQSVRENDCMSAGDDGRKVNGKAFYRDNDDIPVGKPVPNYDVEANGYFHSAPPPQSQYCAPMSAPANSESPKNSGSAMSVIRTIVYVVLAIALLGLGLGLTVGGVAVIIAAFAAISFSAGVWLIAFGVGLIIFSVGCLIIGAAVKIAKTLFKSLEGGAK